MKGEEGSGGASPKEANGIKRSQIKWNLLLFDESDCVFFLDQFIFYKHGELIVYRSIRRPCVCASVCKHFQTRISPQPVGQL